MINKYELRDKATLITISVKNNLKVEGNVLI